jgi:hypothetical protein
VSFASVLAACAASPPSSSVGVDLPALPGRFVTTSCRPGALPDRALTRAEVEKLWARDRSTLSRCGVSLRGLVAFYDELRGQLAATDRN